MANLQIDYADHATVKESIRQLVDVVESISVSFDSWEEPYAKGPGLYIAIISDPDYGGYADPMGSNTWPVGDCRRTGDDAFYETLREVAFDNDGAIVVSVDGVIQEQMVRFRDYRDNVADDEDLSYEDWMGSRHMSALETSLRPPVVATLTLSEETGRVTVFMDGVGDSVRHDEIGEPWRNDD